MSVEGKSRVSAAGSRGVALLLVVVIGFTIFAWPRIIVHWRGESDPWASYLYQYGMGLIVFLVGIGVILRSGACRPGRGRDGLWLAILFLGFVFFALLHAVWILAALKLPYLGPKP